MVRGPEIWPELTSTFSNIKMNAIDTSCYIVLHRHSMFCAKRVFFVELHFACLFAPFVWLIKIHYTIHVFNRRFIIRHKQKPMNVFVFAPVFTPLQSTELSYRKHIHAIQWRFCGGLSNIPNGMNKLNDLKHKCCHFVWVISNCTEWIEIAIESNAHADSLQISTIIISDIRQCKYEETYYKSLKFLYITSPQLELLFQQDKGVVNMRHQQIMDFINQMSACY